MRRITTAECAGFPTGGAVSAGSPAMRRITAAESKDGMKLPGMSFGSRLGGGVVLLHREQSSGS